MDKRRMQALLEGGPDAMHQFIQGYAQNYAANNTDVTEQVASMAEAEMFRMLREGGVHNVDVRRMGLHDAADPSVRKNRLRAFITGLDPNGYNPTAPGAPLDKDEEISRMNLGAFFQDIIRHADNSLDAAGKRRMAKYVDLQNAMSETIPSKGGFLVPEQQRADILSLALESAIVRPRATVYPMTSLSLSVPTTDETSRATSVYGGITFGWAGESEQLAVTEPHFGKVKLGANKAYWYTHIPNELVDDAPALTVWLGRRLPGAVAFNEDRYFIQGNGTGEPLGVLNAEGRIQVPRDVVSQISYEDVVDMFSRMIPASLGNAVWIASNSTIPQLFNMVKTIGTGGSSMFVINASDNVPVTLFGRPIFYTEHARALGSEGDLSFVDLGEYLIGDRMAMQLRTSEHIRFDRDETAMRMIERVDGRPWLPSAITPENGGATLSPYVVLKATTS